MREDILTLDNPVLRNIPLSRDRTPDSNRIALPKGTVVVSTDTHFALREDIWIDRFPKHLKDRAPRIWFDENYKVWQLGIDGKDVYTEEFIPILKSAEDRPGASASDMEARFEDLRTEGVEKEIAFPQSVQGFFNYPDFEVREWIFHGYNEYLGELDAKYLGKFFGVGIANIWDPARLEEAVRQIQSCGLKTFLLPITPGNNKHGQPIRYANPDMDPFWGAIEASGMPICFHIGESTNIAGPGGLGSLGMHQFSPFRRTIGEFIFGGIFDRFPKLKVVFTEANMNWVPGLLQDAEMFADCLSAFADPKINHRPSYYWHKNCWTTFTMDPVGMRLLDMIGPERTMWSTDYPHNESTLGYSWKSIQAVLDNASEDDARKMLGATAMDVYNLV
jgi:predicted TIM-barrel fold metal-dependent hydrolase